MQKSHDTARLKEIPILDVARALELSVKNKKALCFLHDEKTPSLSFDTKTNIWHCFGCNVGGDVIGLVMRKKQLKFTDACSWLECKFFGANNYVQTYTNRENQKRVIAKNPVRKPLTESDYDLYAEIICYLNLSKKAERYLCEKRHLSPSAVRSHNIVSLEDTGAFYAWLNRSFKSERLLRAGLLNVGDAGEIYSLWRKSGIIFPYFDYSGRILNLQIRPYESDKGQKYIFLKGIQTCMYNENRLSQLTLGADVFLCEGAIDTLTMLTAGFEAVGLPGAATLKDEWVDMLSRFNINIVLDSDVAGQKNAALHEKTLKSRNINVQQYITNGFKDVNEMFIAERSE